MKSIGICLIFNGLDMVSGFISALKTKTVMSSKIRDGLFKKAGFLLCYVLAFLLDQYGSYVGFTCPVLITPVIAFYVCTTETISIIENISKINPDLLPEKLIELFNIKED